MPASPASMEGNPLPAIEKVITQDQVRRYAHASGDFNPVHLDEKFAAGSHFGRLVAHGMLTLSFLSEMLTQAFGRYWLESGNLKVRFKKPAYPGNRLRTWGEVTKEERRNDCRVVHCSIALFNSEMGDEEIVSGTATVRLPLNPGPKDTTL